MNELCGCALYIIKTVFKISVKFEIESLTILYTYHIWAKWAVQVNAKVGTGKRNSPVSGFSVKDNWGSDEETEVRVKGISILGAGGTKYSSE